MDSTRPLLGRTVELEAIREVVGAERDDRSFRAVRIDGEEGAGKSALLDAALDDALDAGAVMLSTASSPVEERTAWSALALLVDGVHADIIDELATQRRLALDIALGLRAGTTGEIGAAVSGALRDIFRALSRESTLVVGIDDLQWIDPATAGALSAALGTMRSEAVVVIAAGRPVASVALDLNRIVGDKLLRIELPRLSRSEIARLLVNYGVRVTTPLLDDVDELSAGNPSHVHLLADEIVRHEWTPGRLPRSLSVGYRERIDSLSPRSADVLALATVAGDTDAALLRRCFPDVDVEAALIEIERVGLFSGADASAPSARIIAAVDERLGPVERRRISRLVAEHLPSTDERHPVLLAASCTEPDSAVADLVDAAAIRALDRGARQTAGHHFRRAAELTPATDTAARWRRTLAAADAFFAAGALDLAESLSVDAVDAAADPMQVALAGGVRAQVLAARNGVVDAHAFVVDVLDRLDGWPMLQGLLGRARVRLEQIFDLSAARLTAEAQQRKMNDAGLPGLATEFEVAVANCSFVLGQPVDVESVWASARPIVNVADFIGGGWMALEMLVWGCHDDELVHAALDQFEAGATSSGSAQSLAKVYDFRANHLIRRGDWRRAEQLMRDAVDAATLSELTGSMSTSGLAWVLAATGRTDEARSILAAAPSASAADDELLIRVSHLSTAGFVEFCAADWESAADLLADAWAVADKLGLHDLCALPFRVDLIEALLLSGRTLEAAERTTQLQALAAEADRFVGQMQADRATTLLCAAKGDIDGAIAAAERGLVLHRQIDLPIERARLLLALGSALRRAGRRQQSELALREAVATFEHLGATPFLARAREELARLGERRDPHVLTATEEQIASLVAAGRTNAEVAAALFVSLRTVESNLTRIYRKMGVRSRSELAATLRASD